MGRFVRRLKAAVEEEDIPLSKELQHPSQFFDHLTQNEIEQYFYRCLDNPNKDKHLKSCRECGRAYFLLMQEKEEEEDNNREEYKKDLACGTTRREIGL